MENYKSKCLICGEQYPKKGLTFFKFPKDESRSKLWIREICRLDNLKVNPASLKENGRICGKHFKEKDFTNFKKNCLVQNACPTIGTFNTSLSSFNKEDFIQDEFLQQEECRSEKDSFQCGRCKTQFQLLSEFMDHKRFQCIVTPSEITEEKREKTAGNPSRNILPKNLENPFSERALEGWMKEISDESSAGNQIVSFAMSDNGLMVGNSVDLSTLTGQAILTSQTPLLLIGNSDDAGHVILTSTEGKSVVVKDGESLEPLNGLILADSADTANQVVFSCTNKPWDEGVVLTAQEPPSQVVLTAEISCKTENDASNNSFEMNRSIDASEFDLTGSEIFHAVEKSLRITKIESIREKTKLPCSYCGKVFEKPFNLQQHERVHTGERPFQCIVCGRAFSQKSNVKKHMIRHKVWPQTKQTLKINPDQSNKSQDLLTHMNYSCQYCSSSFKSYSLHKKHLAVHSDYKVYRCIQRSCNKTFSDLDEFLTHSKLHSSAEFQCHICLKPFTNLEELGVHQYDHDTNAGEKKEIEIKLKCEVCHSQFKTVESLKNHLAVDSHNYECSKCKIVFSSERFLRRHLSTHLDSSHSKFKCPSCKKNFRTQKYLNNHVFIHFKEKPFKCEHCGKQFASKYRLKRHLAVHLNHFLECPFKTHLGCDKTFYRKDKLRDHVTTHGHCRLRSCQVCSKTYWSLSKLNQHMKREHTTEKGKAVLKCVTCSQTFRKQKQLTQHHCTVGERKFRSRVRRKPYLQRSSEAVSNIEILMVPLVSEVGSGGDLT